VGQKIELNEFKKQSFLRLLKYAAPYKFRLIIGILAGFAVAGSLFSSFLLLPSILQGVVPKEEKDQEIVLKAKTIVGALNTDQNLDNKEKITKVVTLIKKDPVTLKSQIENFKKQAATYGFHLPIIYENGTIKWSYIVDINIIAEDKEGKMHWQFFSVFIFCFIFLWFIKNLATYINRYFTRWVGTKVVTDLRNEIFERLMHQSLYFYGKMDVGQLISRCTNDTATIERAIANTIADATRCPLEILACGIAIIYFSLKNGAIALPIILFIGLPLAILPLIILGRRIRKIYKKAFKQIANVISIMHETFTGILIIKAFHTEESEIETFKKVNKKYFKTLIRALRPELLMTPAMETVAVGATLVFLVYSYSQGITITILAQLMIPAFMAYQPIKKLAKIKAYMERSMAAADRYFNLIDMDTRLPEKENPIVHKSFENEIKFENISFSYENKKIIDNLDLTIKKGEVVAVVGETGSGKTTIANLMARFYDVDSGKISIDGIDIRDMKIASLRDLIGIVTQDAILFNTTIAKNIAYGCKTPPPLDDIIKVSKQANAHQFISDGRHPKGYEAMAGEKGNNYSGGEKQRISIARAMMKNPPIMILDEATSALDTVTERLVQDALNHLMENRTVFAIAHRLSTIQHANKIIVLERGKIVEHGTHDELLKKNGKYKDLYEMQFSSNDQNKQNKN
jgi:subfamily B ATP-binding cassette protein MsbA